MRRINSRILALMGLMLGIGLWLSLVQSPPQTGERLMQTPQVPAAQQVEVGLHVSNVYNLSLRDKTFSADGWYWLKWPQAVQDLIERDQIPINELVEFPNQVEHWDSRIEGPAPDPNARPMVAISKSTNFQAISMTTSRISALSLTSNWNCRSTSKHFRRPFRWLITRLYCALPLEPRRHSEKWSISTDT